MEMVSGNLGDAGLFGRKLYVSSRWSWPKSLLGLAEGPSVL